MTEDSNKGNKGLRLEATKDREQRRTLTQNKGTNPILFTVRYMGFIQGFYMVRAQRESLQRDHLRWNCGTMTPIQ
jgi:hypothetical protein